MSTDTFQRPENIERLRAEIRGETYRPAERKPVLAPDPTAGRRLFTICTGNRCMELGGREPAAKMLFGEFWYQHEICFLFANTNTGKSVLAVQIANAISRGANTGPFHCQLQPSRVLYADFELSHVQFYRRYNADGQDYEFNNNFYRTLFNPAANEDDNGKVTYPDDDLLFNGLECCIEELKTSVLIIDNLSCLGGGTGNAAGALRIMSKLNTLRTRHKLSILVLAHTPKRYDATKPLSENDLMGSKLLMNFADSAFTIGVSNTDKTLRYLKQIKQRSTHQIYGDNNVCLGRIQQFRRFLMFRFEGHSAERPHLLSPTQTRMEQLTEQVQKLSLDGQSQRQISEQLNVGVAVVNRMLKR